MATDFRPAIDGPRGREKSGESANDHFSGNKHTGFQGSTPEIRNAVQQFNADRKAGKDTTADRAAVLKAQEAHAAKVGIGPQARENLARLRAEKKSGDISTADQAKLKNLNAVANSAKSALKPSPPSQTLSNFKDADNVAKKIEDKMVAYKSPKPQANGAGS